MEGAPIDPSNLVFTNIFTGGGEEFLSYESQVLALTRRYNGLSPIGRELTKGIIDTRVSWIAGNGANIDAEGDKEKEFLESFIEYNGLNGNQFREAVTDGELEGKTLLVLDWDAKEQMPCVRHLAWCESNYKITTDPKDYQTVLSVDLNDKAKTILSDPDMFVYGKFSGSRRYINDAPPRVAMVLFDIDSVSRALRDLRQINHKFGAAFPVFKTETNEDAVQLNRMLNSTKWKIGDSIAGRFDAKYMEPSGSGLESIIKEMLMHFRIISNNTGIPVFFFAPDLMSNRATAAEMMEMINAATLAERESWKTVITEICQKAMKLYSKMTGKILDYEDVEVSIPQVTLNQVQQLVDVYLPLQMSGIISKQTLREMVPGIDPEVEDERLEKEAEASLLSESSGIEIANLTGDPNSPNDIEAEAKAKLKGTVGGVDGILSIQNSVANGITDYEAALALLFEIYGFDEATARKILGSPKKKQVTSTNSNEQPIAVQAVP